MYTVLESWPRNPVARGAAVVWSELPLFAVGGATVAVVWALCRTDPLLLSAAGLVVMPALTALAVTLHSALDGGRSGLLSLVRTTCRAAASSWLLSIPAAVALLLTAAAFDLAAVTGQEWMLLSGGAGLAASAVVAAIGLMAMPLAVVEKIAPRAAWTRACTATLRRPAPALGAVAAFVLAILASAHSSFPILMLLPIPLVGVWVAAFRSSADSGPVTAR